MPPKFVFRIKKIAGFGLFKKYSEMAPAKSRREAHFADWVFHRLLTVLSFSVFLLVISLLWLLADMASPALKEFGLRFFMTNDWNPPLDEFGALPFVYGTLVTSFLALLLAAPISIGAAVFLSEIAPNWLAKVIGFLVEMLAAIPSVVYGLWGIFVLSPLMQMQVQPTLTRFLGPDTWFALIINHLFVALIYPFVFVGHLFGWTTWTLTNVFEVTGKVSNQLFAGPHFGVGILTASVVLAIMITPTIAAISREVFLTVSPSLKEAALALGATRWEMIRMSILQTCKSGMLGAIILGLARALGETMAVTMVIGNRNDITAKLMSPGQTMASVIANEYPEATDLHLASLAAIGLALFAVSLLINMGARLVIWRVENGLRK